MLLRSTLRYLPAQVIGPLFQVIAVVVWTHVTDKSALGVITLVAATHELLQTIFLFWWSQSALRFFGSFRSDEDAARYYRTENAVMLGSVAMQSGIALAVLHLQIAPGANLALSAAVVGYVVTRSYNLYIAERARVRHEILVYSIQQTAGPAVGFLLGLLLIRLFGAAPEWAIAGFAVAQFAAVVAVLPMIRFGWRIGPVDRAIVRQALQYGVPLVLGGGLSWVSGNAARFVVSNMLGLEAAGLFAVGYGLGWRAAAVSAMLVTASAFPIAVRKMEEAGSASALKQLSDNGALLAAVLLPSIAGVYLLRHDIVQVIIAPQFRQETLAIMPLAVLAGAVRNFRAHFSDQVFLLQRRMRVLIAINGIEALLTVGLCIALVAGFGLIGSVMANVVATAVAAALSFAAAIALFGLRLPLLHLVKIAAATALMSWGLGAMAHGAGALSLGLHIAAGFAIYVAALALLYARAVVALWQRRLKPRLSLADRGA